MLSFKCNFCLPEFCFERLEAAKESLCRFIHVFVDKPFEGGAVGRAFGLDDRRDARRRMLELGFDSRLRDSTGLRVVDDTRMKDS